MVPAKHGAAPWSSVVSGSRCHCGCTFLLYGNCPRAWRPCYVAAMTSRDTVPDQPQIALVGVDRAALIFAAAGAAVTLGSGSGDWTPFSTFVGVTLFTITWAFHRPAPPARVPRVVFMRLAFGAVSSLCMFIALGWPLDALGLVGTSQDFGWLSMLFWAVVAVVMALGDRRIGRWLDPRQPSL